MFDTEAIAKRIRAARVHGRRLTQEDFAVEMGIQQSAVSDLERAKKGSGISDLNRLKRLAQTLEVELPYLVFGIGDDGLPTFTEDSTLEAIGLRRIRKTHRTLIVEAIGQENWKDSIVTAYEYLTDRLYVLKSVDEEGCPKRLALLIHEDRIVGTALARKVSIKELKDTSESETMIGRVLNPYAVLSRTNDRFTPDAMERARELQEAGDEEIVIVTALFIEPSMREHGFARMLLSALRAPHASTSIWVSLKPHEMLTTTMGSTKPTVAAYPGQMLLNASIAERMGLKVDELPEDVMVKDQAEAAPIPSPVWAYALSPTLGALTADDGFVQEMALMQIRFAKCEARMKEQKKGLKNGNE